MSKRLQQSKVSGFFKRNRTEVEYHVATLDDDEVEPVVANLQVETYSPSDSCTSSSTPSYSTTHTQLLFTIVNDLSKKGENPRQPSIIFPKNKASRHFSGHWYIQFPWIEYSKEIDAIFCQSCRLFGGTKTEATFSTKGFCDWKKLGDKCRKHNGSVCHAAAVETQKIWAMHQKVGTIDKQLDPNFFCLAYVFVCNQRRWDPTCFTQEIPKTIHPCTCLPEIHLAPLNFLLATCLDTSHHINNSYTLVIYARAAEALTKWSGHGTDLPYTMNSCYNQVGYLNYPVKTKWFWSQCRIMNADHFGYNETPLITKSNRGPDGFVITRVHCKCIRRSGLLKKVVRPMPDRPDHFRRPRYIYMTFFHSNMSLTFVG